MTTECDEVRIYRRTELISTREAALVLGCSEASVRALYSRGRLTRHGPRNRRLADLAEVRKIWAEWNLLDPLDLANCA